MKKILICLVVWFGMVVGVQAKEIIIKKSTESIKDVTPVVKKVEYKEVCDFCGHIFCHKKLYQIQKQNFLCCLRKKRSMKRF